MKVKKRNIGIQQSLGKTQKYLNLHNVNRMTTYPNPDDLTMIAYICKKHGFMFWHNIKTNHGICLFCRQEKIDTIQEWHIKDSEITKEIKQLVEDLMNKRGGEYDMKVEKIITVEDGKYSGVITDVKEKTEPYEYIHFVCEFAIGEVGKKKLDFSCSANVNVNDAGEPVGKLAETLIAFDYKLELGKDITVEDLRKHFVGNKIDGLLKNGLSKKQQKIIEVVTMTPKK